MKSNSFLVLGYQCNKSALVMSLIILAQTLFISGCNFNLLGGKNSEISTGYNPGLRTESLPPTISPITDLEMDENDVVQLPFQISDPDTFLFCSSINVGARSSDNAVIQSTNMTVTGTYPNCILNVRANSVTASKEITVTVDLFDFWTIVSTSFKVTVRRVEKPGPFRITKSEGFIQSIIVHWTNADYMDGTSGRYTLYYREVANEITLPSNFSGVAPVYQPSPAASQSTFVEVRNVKSPFWITAPNNILNHSKTYEIYLTARNGFNNKNPLVPLERSNHVFVRTLDRYRFAVRELVASSRQDFKGGPAAHLQTCAGGPLNGTIAYSPISYDCNDNDRYFTQATLGSPMERTIVPTASGRYRVYLNGQGLMYGEYP